MLHVETSNSVWRIGYTHLGNSLTYFPSDNSHLENLLPKTNTPDISLLAQFPRTLTPPPPDNFPWIILQMAAEHHSQWADCQ